MKDVDRLILDHLAALRSAVESLTFPRGEDEPAWALSQLERGIVAAASLHERLGTRELPP